MTEVPPILLSAVICERVIFDRVTSMPSLINVIQQISAPRYPVRHFLVFFCEFTNGHGKTRTRVKIVDAEQEDKVLFQQEGVVEFKDVKQIVTLAVNLQGITFSQPGEYLFQIFAQRQLLGERRLICKKIRLRPRGGGVSEIGP